MLRSFVYAATAALVLAAGPAFAEDDPRIAPVSAAMPAEIDGYTRSMDDMIEASEEDGQLSVSRIFASPSVRGPVILQVRLWTAEETEAEAEKMLDPEGLELLKAQLIEVNGHPAVFWPGAMAVFPARPDSGVSVMLAGISELDEAVRVASLVDYEALLAIE